MDDIEFEIMLLSEEMDEIFESWEEGDRRKPDWWLIALGSQDAPKPIYDRACDIYSKFKSFCYMTGNHEFNTAVELFTAAMAQNRLPERRR